MQVTYTSAGKDLASQLSAAVKAGTPPDVAVLNLPEQSSLLKSLAASSAVQPIGFVASSLDKYDAFTWKGVGAVGGKLYGLPFEVNDQSAFWYDTGIFKRAGLQAPATWSQLQNLSNRLLNQGIKPFAIAGGDGHSLAQIFANVYLTQQGPARYDKLIAHTIPWTDPSVKAALRATASIVRPGKLARPIARTIASDLPTAAMQLFGAPPRAAMLFGGSESSRYSATRSRHGPRVNSAPSAFRQSPSRPSASSARQTSSSCSRTAPRRGRS
jgi:multiple sugar transport system substrate-binding protein/alpha-glucoside transport system substrate-binding protein